MGSFSIWHWLIVLLVVVLIFGTKKLRNIGGDVGGAVKSFKDAVTEEKNGKPSTDTVQFDNALLVETDVVKVPVVKTPTKKRAPAKKPVTTKATTSTKKAPTVKPKAASASKTKKS